MATKTITLEFTAASPMRMCETISCHNQSAWIVVGTAISVCHTCLLRLEAAQPARPIYSLAPPPSVLPDRIDTNPCKCYWKGRDNCPVHGGDS